MDPGCMLYTQRETEGLKYYIRERESEKKQKRKEKKSQCLGLSQFSSGRVLASVHCNCTRCIPYNISSTTTSTMANLLH